MNPGSILKVKAGSSEGYQKFLEVSHEVEGVCIIGSSIPVSVNFGVEVHSCMIEIPRDSKNDFVAVSLRQATGRQTNHLLKITTGETPRIHLLEQDERWLPRPGIFVQIVNDRHLEVRIGEEIFTTSDKNDAKGKRYISDVHKLCCLLVDCEDKEELFEELNQLTEKAEIKISFHERIVELEAQLEDKEQLRLETNLMLEATGDQNKKRAAELVTKDKLIVLLLTYVNSCQSENLFLLNELEKISDKANKHIGNRITTIRQLLKEIDLKKMIRYATQRGSEIQDIKDRVEK